MIYFEGTIFSLKIDVYWDQAVEQKKGSKLEYILKDIGVLCTSKKNCGFSHFFFLNDATYLICFHFPYLIEIQRNTA